MTISSNDRIAQYVGSGTSTFSFQFKVFQASDLLVVKQDTSTGIETTLTLTTDYTVTLNADQNYNPGGNVITTSAVAVGYNLTITSDIENLQPTDLSNQGGFYPDVINDSFDRATIQIQQLSDITARSMMAPISDGVTNNLELPSAVTRANKFLAFDASGVPMAAAGTNTGNNTSAGNLTLTANNAGSNVARDVIFYDNATETMRVKGSGSTSRLGVGTSTPAGYLSTPNDIVLGNQATSGSGGTMRMIASAGVSYIQSGLNMTAASAAPTIFSAIGGGAEWMRVTNSSVTIGASGTASDLTVYTTATSTINANAGATICNSGNTRQINLGVDDTNSTTWIQGWIPGTGASNITLQPNDGNVGIGTRTPQAVLDLGAQGLGRGITWTASGTTEANNNIFSSYGGVGLVFAAGVAPSTSADSYLSPNSASIGRSMIRMDAFGSNAGTMQFYTNAASTITAGNAVTPTERMRIDSSGNVGIGTNSPGSTLDVAGGQIRVRAAGSYSEANANCGALYYDTTGGTFTMDARSVAGSTAISFRTSSSGTGAERMKVLNSGAVGITQLAGTGNRAVYSDPSGYLTNTSSDGTLKTNVVTVTDGASIVAALRPVRFDWIDQQTRGAQREVGLIAQEVQTVLPEVVGINNDGTLTVDYSHIVSVLIGAVQTLQAKVAALEAMP